ncbi:hypothetical protein ACWNX4_00805 [Candidatus Vidania fulgoroideorum]
MRHKKYKKMLLKKNQLRSISLDCAKALIHSSRIKVRKKLSKYIIGFFNKYLILYLNYNKGPLMAFSKEINSKFSFKKKTSNFLSVKDIETRLGDGCLFSEISIIKKYSKK